MLTYQNGSVPGLGMPIKCLPRDALGPTGKAYFRQTVAAVCAEHEVSPSDVLGPLRLRHLVHARQDIAWRMRNAVDATGKPRFSLPQIGAWMGQDHTTILHSVRAHEARIGMAKA